ncbi:MAG: hypothetical protein LBT37_03875 [Lactobacillaceae bacterium]|nr:hypothetical protein [Lactobacillaceae bacterium]
MRNKRMKQAGIVLVTTLALGTGTSKLFANSTTDGQAQNGNQIQLSVRPETMFCSDSSIKHSDEAVVNVPNTALTNNEYPKANVYDQKLAQVGAVLSQSAYSKSATDDIAPGYTNKDLKILGYSDIQLYDFDLKTNEQKVDSESNIAFTIAHKTTEIDGHKANAFAIILRGTPTSKEWKGNFRYKDGFGDKYAQFWENNIYSLSKKVHATFEEYCQAHEEDIAPQVTNKIFITGHSRGGGTSECLGYMLDKDSQNNTGLMAAHSAINANNTAINKENVLVYALAPTQAFRPEGDDTSAETEINANQDGAYNNIQVIVNPLDFVPTNPTNQWGYQHVGTVHKLFDADKITSAQYEEGLIGLQKVAKLRDGKTLFTPQAIENMIGKNKEFKTIADRKAHDKDGILQLREALDQICPNLSTYDTPQTFQISDGSAVKTYSFSLHEFFNSYVVSFYGGKAFDNETFHDVVGYLMNPSIKQTDPVALAYQKLLAHLPTSPDGPNIGQHLCTTYMGWLFSTKTVD